MIPIHAHERTRRIPWVTLGLIAINVAVFVFELTRPGSGAASLIDAFGYHPAGFLTDPFAPTRFLTVFTSMFLHAGWVHLGGNMLYLWVFGANVEGRLGHVRFGAFYLACGVLALAAQTYFQPTNGSALIGASGAIAGVLGAYLVLFPRSHVTAAVPVFVYVELATLPAAFLIGIWFLLQVAQGVAAVGGTATVQVAWWAHLGGFGAGAVLAAPIAASDAWRSRRRRRR